MMRGSWGLAGLLFVLACGGATGGGSPGDDVRAEAVAEVAAADTEAVESAPEAVESAPEAVESAPEAVEPGAEVLEPVPEALEPVPEPVEVVDAARDGHDAPEALDAVEGPSDVGGGDEASDEVAPPDGTGEGCSGGEACAADACVADGACPACTDDADCDDGLPCTDDACFDGACVHEPSGTCCAIDADPARRSLGEGGCATIPCAAVACVEGRCATTFDADPACCVDGPVADAAWSFEAGLPPGSTVEGPSGSRVAWTTTSAQAADGARSLWFGDPASGTYVNPSGPAGQPEIAVGTVTLPAVPLPAGGAVYAAFDLRLDTEWSAYNAALWELPGPGLAYDQLTLLANGAPVWSSFVYEIAGSTCHYGTCSWKSVEVSLGAYAGQAVALAFRFDSKSPVANDHAGPFVDHLRLVGACAPFDCFSSMECDDPKDALDVCTRDKCLERQCAFERTYASGVSCCVPVDKTLVPFDAGVAPLVVEGSSAVTWTATSVTAGGRAHTGPGTLYLGDPVTHTYADPEGGAVSATARWTFAVPPFDGYDVEWWQWLDLEDAADPARDAFTVTVRALDATDGGQVIFANKPAYGYAKAWRRVVTSLDPWLGQTVEVAFTFDSIDGQANGGEGIYVDDLTTYYGCH